MDSHQCGMGVVFFLSVKGDEIPPTKVPTEFLSRHGDRCMNREEKERRSLNKAIPSAA